MTVALLGAAVSAPRTIFVLGPVSGALVAGLLMLTADAPPRHPPVPRLLVAAGAGLLLVPFLAGTALLGALGVAATVVLLVLGATAVVARLRQARRPRLHGAASETTGPPVVAKPAADFIGLMQTRRLLELWRSSSAQLHGSDPVRRMQVVQLRAVLLEELTRRHPEAVDRWLTHGGGEDPQRYIADDRVT